MSWRVSVQARLLVGGVLISIVAGLLLGTQSCWAVEALLGKRTSASLETMQLVRDEHTLVAEMIKAQMAARRGGLERSLSDRNRETLVRSVQVYSCSVASLVRMGLLPAPACSSSPKCYARFLTPRLEPTPGKSGPKPIRQFSPMKANLRSLLSVTAVAARARPGSRTCHQSRRSI